MPAVPIPRLTDEERQSWQRQGRPMIDLPKEDMFDAFVELSRQQTEQMYTLEHDNEMLRDALMSTLTTVCPRLPETLLILSKSV